MIKNINSLLVYIKDRPLVRDTISITICSTLGNAVGFFIPIFIATYFGVSKETDAFFIAYNLVFTLAYIFAYALECAIVPFVIESKNKNEDVGEFVGNILINITIILSGIFLVLILTLKPLLQILTSITDKELIFVYSLAIDFIPFGIMLVMSSLLAGSLNAYKLFTLPALSPAIRSIVVILCILEMHSNLGILGIVIGYVLGESLRFIIIFFFILQRKIFTIKLSFRLKNNSINFFKNLSYLIVGMFFTSFIPLINKFMASWLGEGNISILEYAEKLYTLPIIFLSSGFMVTILSHWSDRYYSEDKKRFKNDIARALKIVGTLGFVFTICLFLCKGYIVNLFYGYGKISSENLFVLKGIFTYYLIGITPYFLSFIYTRALLTMKKTNAVFFMSLFMIVATIILNYLFIALFGVEGIALANSLVLFLVVGLLVYIFKFFSMKELNQAYL